VSTTPAPDSPRAALLHMIRGLRLSQLISVAAKLRVADQLAHGAKSADQLALELECHADSLYRVLRALAGNGIFVEGEGRTFSLNSFGDLLRSDAPGSLCANAEAAGEQWMWLAWGSLSHTVRTGETAFDHAFGKDTWSWFAENPEAWRLFDQCMDEMTGSEIAAVLSAYDFAGVRTIVDVAGGRGLLLGEILRCNPSAKGILFNLPEVILSAKDSLDPETARRIDFVSGSFFDAVPPGGDVYLLKNILHDWEDEAAGKILLTCARSMESGSKLLVIEHIVAAPNLPCQGKIADVQMMVRNGGRNRTEPELQSLLSQTGFQISRILGADAGPAVIEVRKLR
jgi:hypothetical protein